MSRPPAGLARPRPTHGRCRASIAVLGACLAVSVPLACSRTANQAAGHSGGGGAATTTVTDGAPQGPAGSGRSQEPTTATAPARGAPAVPTTGTVPTTRPSPPASAPAAVSPATPPAPGPVGSYATTLLRPGPATSITVEVLAQDGAAPRSATVDHVVRVLGQVSAKSVTASSVEPLPGAARSWTADDLVTVADAASHQPRRADRAVVHVLFVHGTFGGDDSVLGVSVRGDLAAVFADQVAAAEPALFSTGAVEDAVTMHEVGHLLGLVDLVLATGRADPQHPGHSTDQSSVMYWAVESSLLGRILQGGPPRDFDDQDLADLAAIRSGAGGPG